MNFGTPSTASLPTYSTVTASDQPLPLMVDVTGAIPVADKMIEECKTWLSFHRVWGQLPTTALQAIAQSIYRFRG
ncbi:hypothetical protein [Pantanalinema sp. GBBB05]|uniref:hypothetical protein n=1 Tax=Pantanalinema sp. GBBB05 TaxID=2604139 RepID=UPI001DB617D4|nr:hypothetical protein [Pantanalinema sp. GBBB05]